MRNRRRKVGNLVAAMARNAVSYSAPFVRIIPTDRCNLDCRYCFQKSDDPREMTFDQFRRIVDHGRSLGTGMASFLGGEPLTWGPLTDAIALLTDRGVLSDVTTNGTLLDSKRLDRLGRAGLDLLNVSTDVVEPTEVTAKSAVFRDRLVRDLVALRREHGTRVRINTVYYRDNARAVKALVERAHRNGFPISVGFVVPHLDRDGGSDHCFGPADAERLRGMVRYLVGRKRRGYEIIDTRQYYLNVFRFLRRERFRECNYGRRFGWLNVTPSGRIRGCNRDCYSNCAYDGYYFFRNLPAAVLRYFSHPPGRAPTAA